MRVEDVARLRGAARVPHICFFNASKRSSLRTVERVLRTAAFVT